MNYYILHTKPGYEEKVKTTLEDMKKSENFSDLIGEIIIPTQSIIDIGKKEKITRTKKFFPGYIVVELQMTEKLYWEVKKIPGVTRFLGGIKPQPLSEEEVARIKELEEEGKKEKPKPAVEIEKGDTVRITEGPFTNFMGTVEELDKERGKVKILVNILGRFTPVELQIYQVEKI